MLKSICVCYQDNAPVFFIASCDSVLNEGALFLSALLCQEVEGMAPGLHHDKTYCILVSVGKWVFPSWSK